MLGHGMKASELIKELENYIESYGDCEVWLSGNEYPSGVSGMAYFTSGDRRILYKGYYPDTSFFKLY